MTKVMLVEDDKSLREIYGVRLLAEGYEIISAGDGEEALAMAVKEKPDLILSDVMMPKISGFDMLDILRATPETKDIKVIMMTALSSEDQRARGETLGADRYLVKSQVGIEDVVRTVHDVLADAPVVAAPSTQGFVPPAPVEPNPPVQQPIETPVEVPAPTNIPIQTEETQPAPEPTTIPISTLPPEPIQTPQPEPVPEPVAPPTPEPVTEPAFVAPPAPEPVAETQLPQPTAPFSTAAPASLGDRVINPITPTEPTQDMATLISQELNDGSDTNPIQSPPPNPPVV